jgi:hypothetical protein
MAYIGQGIKQGTFKVLDTSGNTYNGSNVTFSLGTQVGSAAQLLVSHDGVIQLPGTDYTLATGGTQITFSTAPASGASIFIVEISGAVGGTVTPSDASVTSAKLSGNLETPGTLDLNGQELILDADADTSITADTDDEIEIKIANSDHLIIKGSSGDTVLQPATDAKDIKFNQFDGRTLLDINDAGFVGIANGATGAGELRIFEDTDNGTNYVALKAGTISSDTTFTLPTADGSSGQFMKTDGSGALSFATVDTSVDISGTTEESGTLATGDELLVFDASASANRSINIANFLKSHANHTSSSVGTLVLAQANTAVTHGNTLAGSNLDYSHSGTSLSSGTWRAMGGTGSGDRCCWRRIS